MSFSFEKAWEIFQTYWPSFWFGIQNTMLLAISGTLIGLAIGLVVAGIRAMKPEEKDRLAVRLAKRLFGVASRIYIEVFRGTPMIVQAMFIYYTFRNTFHWTPIVAGIFIISINTGAYMAEIVRSGIQAVDYGQTEGARSLGMSNMQTMLLVVLPQAIRNCFPAMGNEFIVNIKDSSVLNVISVTDLYFQSSSVAGSIFKVQETFFVTACIYLCLTVAASKLLSMAEKRLQMPARSGASKVVA